MSNDQFSESEKISPRPVSQADAASVATPARDKAGRRARFWKKGLVALALIGGGSYYYASQTDHYIENVQPFVHGANTFITARNEPDLIFNHVDSDHVNILLVGRDVNWKIDKVYDPTTKTYRSLQVIDKESSARSDTMIVVSLDKTRNTIRMVSLPRDARVYIPENKFDTGRNKLNAAHAFGGVELLKKTLHDELGLTIHHHALIKFDGFKNLIDQVGGVYVDVIGALDRHGKRSDIHYKDNWGGWEVNLKPGKQWLNGEQAHGYVRFRMDFEGDPGRIRRQQSVMRALARRMKELPPWKLPGVVKEIRRQFETSMTDEEVASAGFFAKNIENTDKIQPVTMFGVYGTRGSLILNKPKNLLLLKYVFGPTFNSENFLQRSPWTENDEIEEQGVSPATHELLREAGIIKDERTGRYAASSATPAPDGSIQSTLQDYNSSPLSVEVPSEPSSSRSSSEIETPVERPRRRRETRSREETRGESRDEASASDAEERPRRRRRVRRERVEAEEPAARSETSSSESVSPLPQPEGASSEATRESASAENPGSGSSLNVEGESPIPKPE